MSEVRFRVQVATNTYAYTGVRGFRGFGVTGG